MLFFDGADKRRGDNTGRVSACHQRLLRSYKTNANQTTRTSYRATKWARQHESTQVTDARVENRATCCQAAQENEEKGRRGVSGKLAALAKAKRSKRALWRSGSLSSLAV